MAEHLSLERKIMGQKITVLPCGSYVNFLVERVVGEARPLETGNRAR
jgi:hypothetical protein